MTHDEALKPILLRLPESMLSWLDTYRKTLTIQPNRTQLIRYLIDQSRKQIERETQARTQMVRAAARQRGV